MWVGGQSRGSGSLDPLRQGPDLEEPLWRMVQQVPAGRVTTYGRLAEALGDAVAARWVGHVLLHHDHHPACPCHRVVRAGGEVGGYVTGDPRAKRAALRREGIAVVRGRVAVGEYLAEVACEAPPLTALRQLQDGLAARCCLEPPAGPLETVGAVDVSYASPSLAVAAYALFSLNRSTDLSSLAVDQPVWSMTLQRPVRFPYISSYLGFRELPVLFELIQQVRRRGRLADIVLVDGSGILHPRRAGVATMLGVAADLPTIGVTKKRLTGRVDLAGCGPGQFRPVVVAGRPAGWAVRPGSGSRKPWFISPGHRADLALCHDLIGGLLCSSPARRLPGPLYVVDRLSRRVARGLGGQAVAAD